MPPQSNKRVRFVKRSRSSTVVDTPAFDHTAAFQRFETGFRGGLVVPWAHFDDDPGALLVCGTSVCSCRDLVG